MKKCRDNKCGICCYECEDYGQCNNGNCKDNDLQFDYQNCLFYLDTDNIKIAKVDILTDKD